MADVQLENGYDRRARDYQTALCRVSMTDRTRRVLDAHLILIWGFHRTSGTVSITQLEEITGIDRRSLKRLRQQLVEWRMLTIVTTSSGRRAPEVSIQKDYELWTVGVAALPPILQVAPVPPIARSGGSQTPVVVAPLPPSSDIQTEEQIAGPERPAQPLGEEPKKKPRRPPAETLTLKQLERLAKVRPDGREHSLDDIRAWFWHKRPTMIAYQRTDMGRTAAKWWPGATRRDIDQAIEAYKTFRVLRAVKDLAEQRAAEPPRPDPVYEFDESDASMFVTGNHEETAP